MTLSRVLRCVLTVFLLSPCLLAQVAPEVCPRAAAGSVVPEPEDLRSKDGVLKIELAYRSFVDTRGQTLYCYIYAKDSSQAPTLRVRPGDELILSLKNELPTAAMAQAMVAHAGPAAQMCVGGPMTVVSTNLHFHGLTIPPACHQDDTLRTFIEPSSQLDGLFDFTSDRRASKLLLDPVTGLVAPR